VRRRHTPIPDAKTSGAQPDAPLFSVFDGQVRIGHLLNRGKSGIEAFTTDNISLGLFPDIKSAAAAIPTPEKGMAP
jgi:hypothetical protein